ncbi:hypothetical protein Tco_0585510 [Tanacetum coccineum]
MRSESGSYSFIERCDVSQHLMLTSMACTSQQSRMGWSRRCRHSSLQYVLPADAPYGSSDERRKPQDKGNN